MWLFTIPVLKLAIQIGIAFSSVFLIIQIVRWAWQVFLTWDIVILVQSNFSLYFEMGFQFLSIDLRNHFSMQNCGPLFIMSWLHLVVDILILRTNFDFKLLTKHFFFVYHFFKSTTPNPFVQDERKPRRPYITDQKKRDQILKQPFKMEQVPQDLDAIIIGTFVFTKLFLVQSIEKSSILQVAASEVWQLGPSCQRQENEYLFWSNM